MGEPLFPPYVLVSTIAISLLIPLNKIFSYVAKAKCPNLNIGKLCFSPMCDVNNPVKKTSVPSGIFFVCGSVKKI